MMLGLGDDTATGTVSIVGATGSDDNSTLPSDCAQAGWLWTANGCVSGGTTQDAATSCPVPGAVLAGGVCINPTPSSASSSMTSTYLMLGFAAIAALALANGFHR